MAAVEQLPDVPPAASLLINEIAGSKDLETARHRVKSMLRDLRDQSEAYLSQAADSCVKKGAGFEVYLHGGLDLFDAHGGACSALTCRLAGAERIARSVGLIADRVWLTDFLTDRFINFGRVTNAKLDQVVNDTLVVGKLWPLIAAGIVRFRTPWAPICSSCKQEFDREVERLVTDLVPIFGPQVDVILEKKGSYSVSSGDCFDPPVYYRLESSGKDPPPTALDLATRLIASEVRSALWVGRRASLCGGSVFSNSRVGLSGFLQSEGRLRSRRQLTLLDSERGLNVPWVDELSPTQVVQLRNEASRALPRFRESIAAVLASNDAEAPKHDSSKQDIAELRAQAEEVRAELLVTRSRASQFWKTAYAILGLGLSAYGIGADQAFLGLSTGLIPIMQLLHDRRVEAKTVDLLKSRPGYVLVKAEDIVRHAHPAA